MKVILTQNVENLGKKGDSKEVTNGYARNFLIPKNLAKPATASAIKINQKERLDEKKRLTDEINFYQETAKKINGMKIKILLALGDAGQAFGSVSAKDIADECKKMKVNIEKEWIELNEPVKKTGGWDVKIKLPHGIVATIKVIVEAKKEDKKKQSSKSKILNPK